MSKSKVDLLKEASIFRSLPDESLTTLSEMVDERNYPAGSYVFREGDPSDAVMLVGSGTVEIVKHGSRGTSEIHVADRGAGEVFGEMALIGDSPRITDARARDDVTVLALSKNELERLVAGNTGLAVEIMGRLSARLRQTDLHIIRKLEDQKLELKKANDDLSRERRLLDEIISNAPFFMIITDNANRVLLMNHCAERTFGSALPEIRNRHIQEALRISGNDGVFDEITRSLSEKGSWRGEFISVREDGSPIIVDCTALNVGDAETEGSSGSVLYMGYDATEEKHMQRRAFQLERMTTRSEMAAEIAHELNNYLSIVCGNLELLGMDIDRQRFERVGKKREAMKDGLARITKFVEGLMSVDRPDARREILDLHQFIENELFFLKPQPKFKDIDFICEREDGIPMLEADSGQLQQALFNLLNNAADALSETPPGKRRITLSTAYSRENDMISLTVSDNGCGMTDEDYSRVFRQHFTSKQPGHGFGLLAVKRVIKSHGGKISAAPGPEGGASFIIELPRRMPGSAVGKAVVPA
jgi:PAS domain S-box-containing protein